MAKKRITELATETTLKDGQYVAIDHTTDGTKKLNLGAELTDLKEELEHITGISDDVKVALLQIASKVAYIDDDGQDYYDALYDALYPPADLVSISAVYTQSGTVYDTDSLDSLKADLVVTALYDDQSTQTITNYTLSGTLAEGISTITVAYGGKTATFNVNVTHTVIIDYSLDALSGVSWMDGHRYNPTTGILEEASGEHCTEKFTVQDISYDVICNDGKSTYMGMNVWDELGNYLNMREVTGRSLSRMQLKPNYQYALKIYNTGSFDPSTVTMLPVDKRETAAEPFSIHLTEYINDISLSGNKFELNVSTLIPSLVSVLFNGINRVSVFASLTNSAMPNALPLYNVLVIGFFQYSGQWYLHMYKSDIANLEEFKNYITTNNIVLDINY